MKKLLLILTLFLVVSCSCADEVRDYSKTHPMQITGKERTSSSYSKLVLYEYTVSHTNIGDPEKYRKYFSFTTDDGSLDVNDIVRLQKVSK